MIDLLTMGLETSTFEWMVNSEILNDTVSVFLNQSFVPLDFPNEGLEHFHIFIFNIEFKYWPMISQIDTTNYGFCHA